MRFILSLLVLLASLPAAAQTYIDADLKTLTLYAVENSLLPIKDEKAFTAFANLTDCDLMSNIRNDQFYRQKSFSTFI
jgi:hypothetical protein